MTQKQTDKGELLVYILIFIALCPIILFRDYTPDNELKYLSIADEALESGNLFAFYYQGGIYADKPPLYLWLIMGAKALFGRHINFIIYLFSVIPAIITAYTMNRWCSISNVKKGTFSTVLFSTAFFLAAALVARMDMMMTMFIVLSLYSFYRIFDLYKQNKIKGREINKWRWLFPIFTFFALFTKGPLGIMIPFAGIILFLLFERCQAKTYRLYFGWRTWAVLLTLPSIWFLLVWLEGGNEYLNNLLFHQTVDRAVDAFYHKEPFWYYLVRYWYMVAPWSLLIIIAIINGWFKERSSNSIERLFAVVIISTLLMLSFISSKLEIYLLPALPFIVYLAALKIGNIEKGVIAKIGIIIPAVIFTAVLPAAIYILFYKLDFELSRLELIGAIVMATILSAGGVCALCYIKNIYKSMRYIGGAMLAVVFIGGVFINDFNRYIGGRDICEEAYRMAKEENLSGVKELTKSNTICHYNFRAGRNFDTYFKMFLKGDNVSDDLIKNFKMRELDGTNLKDAKNIVLIYRTRTFKKDSVLADVVKRNTSYTNGTYSICIIKD